MAIISCQRLGCATLEARLVFGLVQISQEAPWHHAPKWVLATRRQTDAVPQHEDAVG